MIVSPHPQRSPGWFADRLAHITASNMENVLAAPSTAAYRNFKTRLALESVTGQAVEEEGYKNQAMRNGEEREPFAVVAYEQAKNCIVVPVGFCRHDELAVGASPDGFVFDTKRGIEVKCPTPGVHAQYLQDPTKGVKAYWHQIQTGMWITERDEWDFVSFCPLFPENARLVTCLVKRDDAHIKVIEAASRGFLAEVAREAELIRNFRSAA